MLAGGKSTRMRNIDKALITIRKRAMISLVIEPLKQVVDEIVVVAANEEQGAHLRPWIGECKLAYDKIKDYGPLAGILSGMEALHSELAFVAACDMPFINQRVVELLFDRALGCDALIPRWDNGRLETLHAVYRREPMISAAKKAIERGEHIILAAAFALPEVKYIPVEEVKKIDPELKTFINVNTLDELRRLAINIKG